ncbi:hypothetical protein TVAG_217300 [Trichomonas vaginalis G3]|uniref:DUF3447 domain-containing protein n=1 Tax=Trichomonas vaginalis (strain ATCC PRA-98 / G3) TaxID=412133 RepID=A2EZB2_TRIV3|nr:protein ubiquitination [Trichomonas vaginalis G3]EAY01993.1 hypothetical protein TVAG_217300 [Trichomonas vaginalis G3]KAI5546436.1 protein ubiquitination [Trichomonas vaginalis G3]|eukprot:XP_001330473.1 hypothetical protein [Trichomonas vaginalis G3]
MCALVTKLGPMIEKSLSKFCLVEDLIWDITKEKYEDNLAELTKILSEKSFHKYILQTIRSAKKYRPAQNDILLLLTKALQNQIPIFTEILQDWTEFVPDEIESHAMTDDVGYFVQNRNSENDRKSFLLSALYGSINTFSFFMSNGAEFDNTVIKNAAIGGNLEIIKILIDKDVPIVAAIQNSIASHQNKVLDLIFENLEIDMKVSISDLFKRSNIRSISHLLAYSPNFSINNLKLIEFGIQMESIPLLKFFINKMKYSIPNDLAIHGKIYKTIFKAEEHRKEMLSYLISQGLNVKFIFEIEDTAYNPLALSIINKDQETGIFLIEQGANCNFVLVLKGKRYPMITLAAKYQLFSLINKLIPNVDINSPSYVSSPNNINRYKKNALIYSIKYSNISFCKMLLKHGADPNYSKLEYSPLCYCCKVSNFELFNYLFKFTGLFPGDLDENGKITHSPLSICIKNGNVEMIKLILDLGYDPSISIVNEADENEIDHLQYAKLFENQEIINIISQKMEIATKRNSFFKDSREEYFTQHSIFKDANESQLLDAVRAGCVVRVNIKIFPRSDIIEAFNKLMDAGVILELHNLE